MPAAKKGDKLVCVGPPDTISEGSATVFINGQPAARLGDGTSHGGKIVIGNPTVIIGDAKGSATVAPSKDLNHIPPAPASFAEARQRLDTAADKIESARAQGGPLPSSPYTTADKMALVENGLQEPLIVRVIKTPYANEGAQLGPPGKPATYWTTTFTQIEHADHDSQEICRTLGMPHDPEAGYTMLLIDQEAAGEQAEMVSFIATSEAMVECLKNEAVDDEELAPIKDDIGPAMTPVYSAYYERLHKQASERELDLDDPNDMADLAEELGFDEEEKDLLGTRHIINRKFGANDQFLGNGLTNDAAANPHTPFGPVQADMRLSSVSCGDPAL